MSSDVDNFLAHYGVRGMRWGKRKTSTAGSDRSKTKRVPSARTVEIMKARNELKSKQQRVGDLGDKYAKTKSATGKAKAEKLLNEALTDMILTDVKSQQMTGREVVGMLVGGPIGMIVATRSEQRRFESNN